MKPRYQVVHTPRFERDFKKLSSESQGRIAEEVMLLETDPAVGKPLHGELKGLFSLRVGRYRVVYEIQERTIVLHRWRTGEQYTAPEEQGKILISPRSHRHKFTLTSR